MRMGQGATFEIYLAACLFQLQEGFCRRDQDLQELVPGAQLMTCLSKPKQLTFTSRFSGEAPLSLKLSCQKLMGCYKVPFSPQAVLKLCAPCFPRLPVSLFHPCSETSLCGQCCVCNTHHSLSGDRSKRMTVLRQQRWLSWSDLSNMRTRKSTLEAVGLHSQQIDLPH